jgi:hypothetical protein
MNLTNRASSPVSPASPFLTRDSPADLNECRYLADVLRVGGYIGIIAPSLAYTGRKNFIIYIDGIHGNICLEVGGDRKPI